MKNILYLALVIVIVLFGFYTLVHVSPIDNIEIPSNVQDIHKLAQQLQIVQQRHGVWVLVIFSYTYLIKQAFCIPGSAVLNCLAGAIFPFHVAFPLVCVLTALGASGAYALSFMFARDYVRRRYSKQLVAFTTTIDKNKSQLVYFLISSRLFPMSPNFLINILSPLVDVPWPAFVVSVVGLVPYNYLCVQAGTLISQLRSTNDILDTTTMIRLAIMALVILMPAVYKRRQQQQRRREEEQPPPYAKIA